MSGQLLEGAISEIATYGATVVENTEGVRITVLFPVTMSHADIVRTAIGLMEVCDCLSGDTEVFETHEGTLVSIFLS